MLKSGGKFLVQESHLLRASQSGHKYIAGEGFYGHAVASEVQPTPH
jgi:hypothetical protein